MRRVFLLALFLLGCLVVPVAPAQQTLGTLSGTVTDPTGATVANSTITLVDDQTAATRTATSNAAGNYTFQALPIGTYTLTISAAGFNTEKVTSVLVQADRTSSLVIKMKPGAVSTSIDVQAAPQLNTTDPTNGYVL